MWGKFFFQGNSTEIFVEADQVPDEYANDTKFGITRYYFQSIIRSFGIGLNFF